MNSSFYLGRVAGIPLGVNYSWFVVFVMVASLMALYYFPWRYPEGSTATYWVLGFATSLLFFASVLAHEIAHGVIALRRGIPVKEITLFFLGGVARITREPTEPATELAMASAGPLSSLVLAAVFALLWLPTRNTVEPLAAMILWLSLINLALAVFNMVPGFPMDGGRVLRAAIWSRLGDYMRATRIATQAGEVVGYLVILGGVVMAVIADPWIRGVWLVFIGLFLRLAASSSYKQEALRSRLRGVFAQDAMTSDCRSVPAGKGLEETLRDSFGPEEPGFLVVGPIDGPDGVLTEDDARRVPRKRRKQAAVSDAMTPVERLAVLAPADNGLAMLEKMDELNSDVGLVVDGDRCVGVVHRDHLLEMGLDRVRRTG